MNTVVTKRLEIWTLRTMSIGAVLIVSLMPIHAFISTWGGTRIGPLLVWKSWKEIILVLLVPIVIIFLTTRPDIARTLWGRWINKLIMLYAFLHIGLSLVSSASLSAVAAGLMMNLRFLAIFLIAQLIAEARPGVVARASSVSTRWSKWLLLGLGVMAILQVFVLPADFLIHFGYNARTTIAPYVLVDQNPHALRAFATLRGPNAFGSYLLLPLACVVAGLFYVRRTIWGWIGLGMGVIALILTGSRSAWLAGVITIVVLYANLLPKDQLRTWLKRSIIPALVVMIVGGWAAITVPALRLAIFHSSPGDSSLNEGSNSKHWQASIEGLKDVVRHPWGSGPGSAGPASFYNVSGPNLSENYYIQIAQEVGILGLGLFIAISVLAYKNIVRHNSILAYALGASFLGITIINLFLHGWADDPTSLTWWACAGLIVASHKKTE